MLDGVARRVLRPGEGLAKPRNPRHFRLLKAGEIVLQTRFVPDRVAFTLNTASQIVCQTLFVPRTASETPSAPPLMQRVTGLGIEDDIGGAVMAGALFALLTLVM